MDTSALNPIIRQATFHAICDVDNPLLGPHGATRVYGPQKGADPIGIEMLENGLTSFASLVYRETGRDGAALPGSGAAGGLGYCLWSFLHASMRNGMEALMDVTHLPERIREYDLIITGEGRLDAQTEAGKAPLGMLRLGQEHSIPVICLCGQNRSIRNPGFREIYAVVPDFATYEEAMTSPVETLTRMVREIFEKWLIPS
jgi:glycerate kinase